MADLVARAAAAQDIGARNRQEDAVVAHASHGADPTLAVLSDGMGGHDDGDLASRIIAREMFGELFLAAARPEALRQKSADVFRAALKSSNRRLKQHIDAGHLSGNTGGTVIGVKIYHGQLHWLSVGDSLLYHMRGRRLRRLNEIHSMAAQLDQLVARDELDPETAEAHPDRNCLTSAVTGYDIPKVDCPDGTHDLEAGDIVILASDGIAVLEDIEVREITHRMRRGAPGDIARALLDAVRQKGVPDQDNTSIIAIKIEPSHTQSAPSLAGLVSTVARCVGQVRHRLLAPRLRT